MLKKAVPILASLDAAATIDFYTTKLRFAFKANWDGYLIFEKDDIALHLWPTTDPEVPKATGCYFNVTEVDALFAEYDEQGVVHPNGRLKDTPWGMRQFSILDNNGNIMHFGQEMNG